MTEKGLEIKISADGEQARRSVQDVAGDIDQLAGTLGGELGQQAAQAAARLRELGRQQEATEAFLQLRTHVGDCGRTLKGLKEEANAWARQITQAGPPTAQEAAHLDKLRGAVAAASAHLAEQRSQLKQAAAHMQRHGVATQGASRALDGINSEIRATAQGVAALHPKLTAAVQGWQGLGASAGQASAALGKTRRGLTSISEQLNQARQAAGRMGAALAGAFSFGQAVQVAADMEKLQAGLQAVTGDAARARAEMDFVRRVATSAGVDVAAAGSAWLGLAAATKGTAVEGQAARDVFAAVSAAMARTGKSSAETKNALIALAQMASKGVVSMEEMRGQLGEALPGAFQAAAQGMGITVQELGKLIESGQLTAQDIFPALARGLGEIYGGAPAAQTLSQEITGIKNAFADMADRIGQAGGLDALKRGAEVAQTAITLLGDALVTTGKSLGALMGAVATLDFSGLKQAFADIEAESREKLLAAAQHNDTLRSYMAAMGNEATRAALAAQQQGQAVQQAAEQAAESGTSYAALSAAYAEVNTEMQAQIALADKEITAAQARGQAAIAEARLKGDEALLRQAIGQAALQEADAIERLALQRQGELLSLRAELRSKQQLLAAQGDLSDERRKELEQLQTLIEKKQIDADRTRAQAAAARDSARAKGEEAQAAQAALTAAQASLTARLADARASVSLLQTQKDLAGQSVELARLMGNEEAARQARIQQLRIDIQLTRAKAEVMRTEAQGAIEVAQATRAELAARGALTALKRAELDATIKLAQAKLKEADALRQSARLIDQTIHNLRNYGQQAAASGQQAANAYAQTASAAESAADRIVAAKQREIEASKRAQQQREEEAKAYRERWNVDESGLTRNTAGRTASAQEPQALFNQRLIRYWGEDMLGSEAARQATTLRQKLEYYASIGVSSSPDGSLAAMKAELERLMRVMQAERMARREASRAQHQGAGARSAAPSAATGGDQQNAVVNIHIGGAKHAVRTDAAGAKALQSALRELQQASQRAA